MSLGPVIRKSKNIKLWSSDKRDHGHGSPTFFPAPVFFFCCLPGLQRATTGPFFSQSRRPAGPGWCSPLKRVSLVICWVLTVVLPSQGVTGTVSGKCLKEAGRGPRLFDQLLDSLGNSFSWSLHGAGEGRHLPSDLALFPAKGYLGKPSSVLRNRMVQVNCELFLKCGVGSVISHGKTWL